MRRSPRALLSTQARAAAVLGATLDLPGTRTLARLSKPPVVGDEAIAGTSSTIVRPGSPPPWPALVFVNGATPDGRAHPMVLRLSLALARSGQLVFIPDLPGIAGGELSPATLAASNQYVRAAADSTEAAHGRIGLAGVSVGASLALLTAAEPGLAERISVVACVAPYTDMANVMLLATTRHVPARRAVRAVRRARVSLGRAGALGDRRSCRPAQAFRRSAPSCARSTRRRPIRPRPFRDRSYRELGDEAVSVLALLTNRDPARFDDLYAGLPAHVRSDGRGALPASCRAPACARRSRS